MFFLNAQLILWYCNVSLWLENGQTADFVPLNAFCIASSRPGAGADQEQRQCASGAPSAGPGSPGGLRGLSQVETFTVKQK